MWELLWIIPVWSWPLENVFMYLLGEFLRLEWQGYGRCVCPVLVNTDKVFPKVVAPVNTPTIRVWEFCLSYHPLTKLSILWPCQMFVWWLDGWFNSSSGCVVIWHCHLNLHFPVDWSYGAHIHIFLSFGYLFCEVSVRIFCPIIEQCSSIIFLLNCRISKKFYSL